jgi:hypothetical protein
VDHTYVAMATVFPDGRVIFPKSFSGPMISWDSLPDSTKIGIKDGRIRFGTAKRLPNSKSLYDSVSFTDWKLLDIAFEDYVSDISFIINRLEELNEHNSNSIFSIHLNLELIGAMGFSNGGGITREVCERDQRIKAEITIDASTPYSEKLIQPLLCLLCDRQPPWPSHRDDIVKTKEKYSGKQLKADFVLIKGTLHNNFTDGSLYSPLKQATDAGPIDPVYAHHIINSFTVAFFDKYLKGNASISISALSKKFTEIYYDSMFSE